jgi:hypothetical protein
MCASRPDELVGSRPQPLTSELLRAWPLPLNEDDDKHDRGTVLVVAGSERTPGAALLAGLGALRAGAGRVQIATTASAAAPLSIAVPEALVQGLPATSAGAIDPEPAVELLDVQAGQADAVLLGPVGPWLRRSGSVESPRRRRVAPRVARSRRHPRRARVEGIAHGCLRRSPRKTGLHAEPAGGAFLGRRRCVRPDERRAGGGRRPPPWCRRCPLRSRRGPRWTTLACAERRARARYLGIG